MWAWDASSIVWPGRAGAGRWFGLLGVSVPRRLATAAASGQAARSAAWRATLPQQPLHRFVRVAHEPPHVPPVRHIHQIAPGDPVFADPK